MSGHILIVEDDPDIQDALRELLEMEGYRVATAANGKEALKQLEAGIPAPEKTPQLILLDLMMPIMDGIQFRSAQRADARLSSIPVVLMSADSQADKKLKDADLAEYLKKPLDLDRVLSTVKRFCQMA